MQFDFSQLNLAYLIQARDLVIAHPGRAGAMLGISDPMVAILPDLTPQLLAAIDGIHQPLIRPHPDIRWWSRLLRALEDGRSTEIATLLDHAALTLVAKQKAVNDER